VSLRVLYKAPAPFVLLVVDLSHSFAIVAQQIRSKSNTNALDGETVSCSSINAFKNRLNKIRMTRMGYFMD